MRDSIIPSENTQSYTIINDQYAFGEGCAKFMYSGYEISFSTKGYQNGSCLNEVCVFDGNSNVPLLKANTVEEAIDGINSFSLN